MTQFTPVSALIGGTVIGIAAVLLMKFNGRIAGISGILNGIFSAKPDDRTWRILFILGLILGGLVYQLVTNQPLVTRQGFPLYQLIGAGLLVGFGTSLGSGCTSGHGVCGIARVSPRSIVATVVFLLTGFAIATSVAMLFGSQT